MPIRFVIPGLVSDCKERRVSGIQVSAFLTSEHLYRRAPRGFAIPSLTTKHHKRNTRTTNYT
jgi:hypothetical protein